MAVNRLWQWHFGEGLHKTPSDFGKLGGTPANPRLLDWLASEFVTRDFSMKAMHRLIVTSETYKLASDVGSGASRRPTARPTRTTPYLWHFRLQRLEAEPIWDSILGGGRQPRPDRRRPVVRHRAAGGDAAAATGGTGRPIRAPTAAPPT